MDGLAEQEARPRDPGRGLRCPADCGALAFGRRAYPSFRLARRARSLRPHANAVRRSAAGEHRGPARHAGLGPVRLLLPRPVGLGAAGARQRASGGRRFGLPGQLRPHGRPAARQLQRRLHPFPRGAPPDRSAERSAAAGVPSVGAPQQQRLPQQPGGARRRRRPRPDLGARAARARGDGRSSMSPGSSPEPTL